MKKNIELLIMSCLMLGACGKRNQGFQESPLASAKVPAKGTMVYQLGEISTPVLIYEDEVIVPNKGRIKFSTGKDTSIEKALPLSEKNEFIKDGITFRTVDSNFNLKKINPNHELSLNHENFFLLAAYKLEAPNVKLKLSKDYAGKVFIINKTSTATYAAKTGEINRDSNFNYPETLFPLKAELNESSNEIYFYIQLTPTELSLIKQQPKREGREIRNYDYPFCTKIEYSQKIFYSEQSAPIAYREKVECDIENNFCFYPNSPSVKVNSIKELLNNTYFAGVCTEYDTRLAGEVRTLKEKIGLSLIIANPKLLQVIPEVASVNANTELLDQNITFPDSEFIFQK